MKSTTQPGKLDILLGRQKDIIAHCGNRRLRRLVDMHVDTYIAHQTRTAKTRMVVGIVAGIQEAGGTFLKRLDPDSNEWTEVDDKAAREKVGHLFRDACSLLKKKNAKEKEKGVSSSRR
uniref:DUF6824 domain-containing protein n=1 Tax=Grammatophora oceanica TaxID=210454 RepID=A0A7S1YD18_9STRA|mmetsp:Transcript_42795/g.63488  ORF Transcript_42795/g.63488 Transcript_42795/m.63488 type:complete len:119 (+) Transcript_42795:324-680(+)